MRLFIAIELPDEIKDFLSQINSSLKNINGLRTVNKESMHLTLLFLGDIKNQKEVIETLNLIEFKEFKITISNLGFFPDKKRIKVAWIGVNQANELMMLQKQIASLFNNQLNYFPHITFARIKHISEKDKNNLFDLSEKFKKKKFVVSVNKFKLFSSELTKIGPIHRIIESFPAK